MSHRWRSTASWVGVALLCGAGGVCAGRATFTPPAVAVHDAGPVLYTVSAQTVGRALSFPVAAHWASTPLVTAAGAGTVTSVAVRSGATVNAGDVLYTVDLRPVVVAQGSVPAFRDLPRGSTGADVRQVRQFLADRGYLPSTATGQEFDAATVRAVTRWQKDLGVTADGVVHAGDLVFAARLPARVTLSPTVVIGARIDPGAVVVNALADAPDFVIDLAADQAALVPTSGPVQVVTPTGPWDAVIASASTTADNKLHLDLKAPRGGAVCGDQCAQVPIVEADAIYTARILTVPDATGPAVPTSAITTSADGSTFVTEADGSSQRVTVLSHGDGRAVVSGLSVGDRVRLFAVGATPEPSAVATP